MPRQGTSAFEGVLHLHGRIEDDDLSITRTDLVLTSAEFGEAYLRSGWATRYVYDLARAFTLVLVGYRADDPPMRYLLEALEDDRSRYPDLHAVYAFAPAAEGTKEREEALWLAKGVRPLIYRSDTVSDHGRLHATLKAWCDYAQAPSEWRQRRLKELFSSSFGAGREADVAEAAGLLAHGDAPRLLETLAPDATWWTKLSRSASMPDRVDALGAWLASRAQDADMVRACVSSPPQRPEVLNGVLRIAASQEMPANIAAAWRLLARSCHASNADASATAWYTAARRLQMGGCRSRPCAWK